MTEYAQVLANRHASIRRARAAMAAYRYGLSDFSVLFVGDSTTRGVNGLGGSAAYPNSFPNIYATMLSSVSGYAVASQQVFASAGGTTAQLVAADSRVSVTGTWTPTTKTLGGRMLTATASATMAVTFPACKKIDVYFAKNTGKGTVNVNVDGGADTLVDLNAAPAISKTTLDGGSVGAHTVNISWTSGTIDFIGAVGRDDTRKNINVINGGYSGAVTGDITTGTGPWDTLTFIKNTIQPNLVWYNLGINNARFNNPATFETDLRAHLDALTPTIDVILETLGPDGDTTNYPNVAIYREPINDVIRRVGREYRLLVHDLATEAGSYAEATALGFLNNDKVHPTFTFSAFRAQAVFDFLKL